MKQSVKILGFLYVVFWILLISGCREPELNSKWLDREINVDGMDNEWQDCRLYYDEDTRTIIGMYNDEHYLYLHLSSRDKVMQRKILWLGLTVWFDNKGGKEKRFGIQYPLGMVVEGRPIIPDIPGKDAGRSGMKDRFKKMQRNETRRMPDRLSGILGGAQSDPVLLGPDEDDRYIMFDGEIESLGILAKVGRLEGNFVYEFKVPLKQNKRTPYAIGTGTTGKIGVGFETGKMDRKKMGGRHGPGKMRGDLGGKHGGPGGEIIEPWELWIKVQLTAGGK